MREREDLEVVSKGNVLEFFDISDVEQFWGMTDRSLPLKLWSKVRHTIFCPAYHYIQAQLKGGYMVWLFSSTVMFSLTVQISTVYNAAVLEHRIHYEPLHPIPGEKVCH